MLIPFNSIYFSFGFDFRSVAALIDHTHDSKQWIYI